MPWKISWWNLTVKFVFMKTETSVHTFIAFILNLSKWILTFMTKYDFFEKEVWQTLLIASISTLFWKWDRMSWSPIIFFGWKYFFSDKTFPKNLSFHPKQIINDDNIWSHYQRLKKRVMSKLKQTNDERWTLKNVLIYKFQDY